MNCDIDIDLTVNQIVNQSSNKSITLQWRRVRCVALPFVALFETVLNYFSFLFLCLSCTFE